MLLATDLAAFDHHEGTITLIANAVNWDDSPERVDAAYDDAVARLDAMTEQLPGGRAADRRRVRPARAGVRPHAVQGGATTRPSRTAEEAIQAGEAFQIVPSQRFEIADGRRRAGHLPRAADVQPEPVHVPAAAGGLRHRRLQPRIPGHGAGRPRDHAPDRGHALARRRPGGGRAAGEGPAGRREGARRAPDARRPRPQRPRPGLQAGHRARRRLLPGRALQPRHAHRVDRHRRAGRGQDGVRRGHRVLPGRHAVRRAEGPRDGADRGAGAGPPRRCTAASSATSTSPATRTPRSRSAPRWCEDGDRVRAGRAAGSSPTRCRTTRTPSR